MNKRDLILDSLEDLLTEEKGASCSVREIAQKAGIAKGGIYYYFQSKEEIFDALVERTYHSIILQCQELLNQSQDNAIQKLNLLYTYYRTSFVSSQLDEYLHQPQNAYIHQKSLAKILLSLSPIPKLSKRESKKDYYIATFLMKSVKSFCLSFVSC